MENQGLFNTVLPHALFFLKILALWSIICYVLSTVQYAGNIFEC